MYFWNKWKLASLRKKLQQAHRETTQKNANPKNEIVLLHKLAHFYAKHRFDKSLPRSETYLFECYRTLAGLGDAKAHYFCGQRLLEQGKFWAAFSKDAIFGNPVHVRYAKNFYEEAFAYLNSAEEMGSVSAKRLLGMAYLYGWGVTSNKTLGYEKIFQSIDLEKAWDRVNKIIQELKLNPTEFFQAHSTYQRTQM